MKSRLKSQLSKRWGELLAFLGVFVLFGMYVVLGGHAAVNAPYVQGNQLKFGDGSRYVVKGVTLYTMAYYDNYTGSEFNNDYAKRDQIFAAMKANGINSVRLALTNDPNAYSFAGGQTVYVQKMADFATSANAHGLYVSFCLWSAMGDAANWPNKYQSEIPILGSVYQKVGPNPMVMYEPWNEPNGITWAQWNTAMQYTVKYFRQTLGYNGVLQLDTINWSWSFDPTQAQGLISLDNSLIGKSNIMFANHRYANNNACFCGTEQTSWQNEVGSQVGTYPIIGTEYGFYDGSNFPNNPQWDKDFFAYLAATSVPAGYNGMYAFAWHWADLNNLTTDYINLSPQGQMVKSLFWDKFPGYNGPTDASTPAPTPTLTPTPSASASPTPATPTPTPGPPLTAPVRLQTGSTDYTDPFGNVWKPDAAYATAGATDAQGVGKITGTTMAPVYENERWGTAVKYHIPITNGTYTLRLHFAEIYPAAQGAGARLFSGTAEGSTIFTDLDIFREVGAYAPDVKTYTVSIADGALDLSFVPTVNNAKISGLEILPPPGPTPTSTPKVDPVGAVIGDMDGNTKVDVVDLGYLLGKWGTADSKADINRSGNVDISDLSALLGHWTG